ncbi:MAG: hypothetical protein HY370_01265 [Proteobacteria bacterium]|nr:hypothetical protein [Pseudomonadota bacterium]
MSKGSTKKKDESGVQLPKESGSGKPSASGMLYGILRDTRQKFFDDLVKFYPRQNAKSFGSLYREVLFDFEKKRAASPHAEEIALYMADLVQERMVFAEGDKKVSLAQHFNTVNAPMEIEIIAPPDTKAKGYEIAFPRQYGGYATTQNEIRDEIDALLHRNLITSDAAEIFHEVVKKGSRPGGIALKGMKLVLLGGMAELSPLPLLLKAGADVLTTYRSPESRSKLIDFMNDPRSGVTGRLFLARESMDLLKNPGRIAATAAAFAGGEPVHLGAFAYKGGRGQEWRLAAAQDGIARSLGKAGLLKSYTVYASSSVPAQVSPETAAIAKAATRRHGTLIPKTLNALSLSHLCEPNVVRDEGGRFWTNGLMPLQGTSYAAANLIGKTYAAEYFAGKGVRVSANVAPVANTGSMKKVGVIQRAFSQAHSYGIKVFEPQDVQTLMFLQMVHDLTCGEDKYAQNPALRQVHGGVFTAPYSLDSCMRGGVVRSLAKSLKPW